MGVRKIADPAPSDYKKTQCKNCMCTFEYLPKNVQCTSYTDYGGKPKAFYYIMCTKCHWYQLESKSLTQEPNTHIRQ